MKILGVTCGIGSMMVQARHNHEIIGNIEWRPYYHTGTFEHNFKGSYMAKSWDKLSKADQDRSMRPDLLIGHTECGNFSRLNTVGFKESNVMDLPFFVDIIQKTQPKTFVMDNLPQSLISMPLQKWIEDLPEYKIELAWISNYNYGNTQKRRDRMFVIGSRRELGFTFIPGEFQHDWKLGDVIEDLPKYDDIPEINHVHLKPNDKVMDLRAHYFELKTEDGSLTFQQFKDNVDRYRLNRQICYVNKAGEFHKKPGYNFMSLDNYSPTINGRENAYREDTYQPFTVRERARIQGLPDDFILFPLIPKNQSEKLSLIKQTGKCMPTQFCDYITRLIADHLGEGPEVNPSGVSYLKPNLIIQEQLQLCADLL